MKRRIGPTFAGTAARVVAAVAALGAAIPVAGCGGTGGPAHRVGIAYEATGPVGMPSGGDELDQSVHAVVDRMRGLLGAPSAVRELPARAGESDDDRYDRLIILCESGYDPVIAVGPSYVGTDPARGPLGRAASTCPRTHFAVVDDSRLAAANVADLVFADDQGGFLMGAVAALRTRTGRVAILGGCPTDSFRQLVAGYRAGAAAVRPGTAVTARYLPVVDQCAGVPTPTAAPVSEASQTPGVSTVEATRAASDALYDGGADVVFQASGWFNPGVCEAAKPRDAMVIGFTVDEYARLDQSLHRALVTSLVRDAGSVVYEFVRKSTTGGFVPGIHRYGMDSGDVRWASTGGRVDDLAERLRDYRQRLQDGRLSVSTVGA